MPTKRKASKPRLVTHTYNLRSRTKPVEVKPEVECSLKPRSALPRRSNDSKKCNVKRKKSAPKNVPKRARVECSEPNLNEGSQTLERPSHPYNLRKRKTQPDYAPSPKTQKLSGTKRKSVISKKNSPPPPSTTLPVISSLQPPIAPPNSPPPSPSTITSESSCNSLPITAHRHHSYSPPPPPYTTLPVISYHSSAYNRRPLVIRRKPPRFGNERKLWKEPSFASRHEIVNLTDSSSPLISVPDSGWDPVERKPDQHPISGPSSNYSGSSEEPIDKVETSSVCHCPHNLPDKGYYTRRTPVLPGETEETEDSRPYRFKSKGTDGLFYCVDSLRDDQFEKLLVDFKIPVEEREEKEKPTLSDRLKSLGCFRQENQRLRECQFDRVLRRLRCRGRHHMWQVLHKSHERVKRDMEFW